MNPTKGRNRCVRCRRCLATTLFDFGTSLPDLFPDGKAHLCSSCGRELAALSYLFVPKGSEA